jgi:hypothetical protein
MYKNAILSIFVVIVSISDVILMYAPVFARSELTPPNFEIAKQARYRLFTKWLRIF